MRSRRTLKRSLGALVAGILISAAPAGKAFAAGEYEPLDSVSAGYEQEKRRSEWFYIDAQGGLQAVNLQTFRANEERLTAGIVPSSGVGPAASLGLGLRLVFVTLGVRARVGAFDDTSIERTVGTWQMWSLNGELGLRVPLGRVEPYFRAYGGYTTFGSFDDAIQGLGEGINIDGANLGATLGFDWYATPVVSLGLGVGGDLLFLARRGIALRDLAEMRRVETINEAKARILEGDGSSIGSSLTFLANAGLHF